MNRTRSKDRSSAFLATDGPVDEDDLESFCKEHTGLADYKRPRRYELMDELERTTTGKKQRYKYRD